MNADQQETPLNRLAAIVRMRRLELGMSINALAAAAGTSTNTYRRVEQGEPARDVAYAKVESALGWATGSVSRILNGGEPMLFEASGESGVTTTVIPEEDLSQAVTSAMVAVSDTMTGAEIRETSRLVVEELKRRGLV